jgi:hypothetical protein
VAGHYTDPHTNKEVSPLHSGTMSKHQQYIQSKWEDLEKAFLARFGPADLDLMQQHMLLDIIIILY